METKLSKREIEVMQAIEDYINKNKYPPVVREICKIISVDSTSLIREYLIMLERKGYIQRLKNVPRAIKVLRHI